VLAWTGIALAGLIVIGLAAGGDGTGGNAEAEDEVLKRHRMAEEARNGVAAPTTVSNQPEARVAASTPEATAEPATSRLQQASESAPAAPRTAPAPPISSGGPSPESKLATIDTGKPHAESDATVRRYAATLEAVERKCSDGRVALASKAVVAQSELRNRYGKRLTTLEILQAVDQSIPPAAVRRVACADIFATLVALIGAR
jgi:hypothetical protein